MSPIRRKFSGILSRIRTASGEKSQSRATYFPVSTCAASLYKAFPPEMARALLDKLEFVYTPKHGSWLNMAECEFSVLGRQCLARRLPDMQTVTTEIAVWVEDRNQKTWPADWRFTTEDARIKLKRLYPKLTD